MTRQLFIWTMLLGLTAVAVHGQTISADSLNQIKDGKKEGWQIEYLDLEWNSVKKEKSYYYRYNYFIKGKNTQPIMDLHNGCTLKTDSSSTKPTKGQPIVLNGKYTWHHKDGRVLDEQQYKNGVRTGIQKNYQWYFVDKKYTGTIAEEADYDKKYNALVYSYYYISYDKNGNIKFKGYYRFGDKGYAVYEDK